jgi:ketosteroid isomerase-like protein
MKTFLKTAIGICALLLSAAEPSVSAQPRAHITPLQAIVETERAFSRMSEEQGIREAFTAFIADDGILFRPRAVKGKEWMQQHPLPASKSRPLLAWQPIFAAVSSAGDLGYTTGPWQYKNDIKDKRPSAFGDFMTIWKKQADGSWKFVLDLGVSHPQSAKEITPWRPSQLRTTNGRGLYPESARAQILNAEKDFAQHSIDRGAVTAFLLHAATDVRLFRENHEPFIGRKAAAGALTPLTVEWSWEATFVDVSKSGDLGYSYGTYRLRDKASAKAIEEGNFARVWKRINGAWRVVIDVANPVAPGQ